MTITNMRNTPLKDAVMRILPRVQTPAQYLGGELNSVVKDHRQVRGKLCLAFPDAYGLGMSHHGLQVLYTIMNNDPQCACERAFTPWLDFEAALRAHRLPLYSLETFTPLRAFDLVGCADWAYAPMFYEPEYHRDGTIAAMNRTRSDVPREILACTIRQEFDAIPLPTRPIVPFVETTHDRIAIEIMRGCPWQCRFCQSTVIKRPLRVRSVETIVQAALDSYRNTGHNEISLLSLSSSDYPHFEELVKRMHEVFTPLG